MKLYYSSGAGSLSPHIVLADLVPGNKLVPASGTMERYRLQEWLNYIASQIHKGFG